jgi:hypothetical protein
MVQMMDNPEGSLKYMYYTKLWNGWQNLGNETLPFLSTLND